MSEYNAPPISQTISFKAETHQLLDILIHSLYTDKEVFLRELISNASDALTRIHFEMLTNRDVLDPDVELTIRIIPDKEHNTLTITDTGIGMTADELVDNLGTIAHSGVKEFIKAAQDKTANFSELIGQFGVGFYSAFMVSESITVTSRSYRLDASAAKWSSTGSETYIIETSEKKERGTVITLKLNPDESEFTQENRLRQVITRHSDYIPFPIYLGDGQEPVNHQTALWRQQPRQVEEQQYTDFYKQMTLDTDKPLIHVHVSIDAPVQLYALLYLPGSTERQVFSPRRQDGLKLYARKVLIQEYCTDLLPQFLRNVQGVVDSEDVPLNVSRETIQSSRTISQIKKIITTKILETLKTVSQDKPDEYEKIWQSYALFLKEGVATDFENYETLLPLLRFHTLSNPDKWISLEDYTKSIKEGQEKIYYIMGSDSQSVSHSPHLDMFRHNGYDVLLMVDSIDPFMLMRLNKFGKYDIANVSIENNFPSPTDKPAPEDSATSELSDSLNLFKNHLKEKVVDVRFSDRLIESPARLVDIEGALPQELQRVYQLLHKEFETPGKILEINPKHPLITSLNSLPQEDPILPILIEQIYDNALLIEGLHPNPSGMVQRIQELMQAALLKSKSKSE